MLKIEHIGIAVKNLEEANSKYEKLLGRAPYKTESVESEGVNTSFFQLGESKLELLEASSENSPIQKYLDKRGEGMHHIAFEVEDIHSEIDRLVGEGFELIGTGPKDGADNKLVCFFHPKSTHGLLIELCQEKR
ncbi:MAG: methylmalonyl-CoA epimerase [Flavobacteriales bacterium]|nr:methylmalonyl-CoA epimerase [Flavobacteriales bacterium]